MNCFKIIAVSFIITVSLVLFLGTDLLAGQKIPGDLRITLERTPCYGRCPFYKLTIRADGKVVFEPLSYEQKDKSAATRKAIKGSVTPDQLREIIAEFEKINFFSLKGRYGDIEGYTDQNCPDKWDDFSIGRNIFNDERQNKKNESLSRL